MQGRDDHVTASGATATTSATAAAEQASIDALDRLVAGATDDDGKVDDVKLLELIREHLTICVKHAKRVRNLRDEAMVRQRAAGVSNLDLREATGLSDSGVSRRIVRAGGKRRIDRRSGPTDRRTGFPERRLGGSS